MNQEQIEDKGVNKVFRNWMAKEHPGAVMLEPGCFDGGIIGVMDGHVVYGYDELCEALASNYLESNKSKRGPGTEIDGWKNYGWDEAFADAIDWVEFNTIRSLPYAGPMAPIIAVFDPESERLVDQSDTEDTPEPLEFQKDCPGLARAKRCA